jgi:phosphoglycolate phosphatase-like HAD superfamily hydrolase
MARDFFVGVDSDGTVFDSMTIKHRDAFIPSLIEIWQCQTYAKEISEICEKINLFSKTRGIDRFSGLLVTFERMEKIGIPVPAYRDLEGFLNKGVLSNAALEKYLTEYKSEFLEKVLAWSKMADDIFKAKMEALLPFEGISECFEKVSTVADIAVISSASLSSLEKDWKKEGIDRFTSAIYGQEHGNKKIQLKKASEGYATGKKLMIGDALGDYEAAKSIDAWFYPILPGKEQYSWKLFEEYYFSRFINGEFNKSVQKDLINLYMKEMGE